MLVSNFNPLGNPRANALALRFGFTVHTTACMIPWISPEADVSIGGGYGEGSGAYDLTPMISSNNNRFIGVDIQYRVSCYIHGLFILC